MSVEQKTQVVQDMEDRRQLGRTLVGGTEAMRAAGEKYLPKEIAETATRYENRIKRSVLTNFYNDTVKEIVSKVFSKPIELGQDMSETTKGWCENIDLNGSNLDTFAQQVFKDALEDAGIGFIYVDMPQSIPGATLAAERALNIRPYFTFVRARDVLGWKTQTIDNVERLTQFRIAETATKPNPDDEFTEICVNRVRVIEPNRVRVYEEVETDGKKDWIIVQDIAVTIGEVPVSVCYLNKTGFMTALPPLEDLGWLNLLHWQSSSDQRNILHVARVPILFGKGFEEDKQIEISSSAMVKCENVESDLKFVEHNGNAIDSGRADLQDIEQLCRDFGLCLFMPRSGSQTATGQAINAADTYSMVQSWALAMGDCIEQAFVFAARWIRQDADTAGSVTMNTDYGITAQSATDLDTLNKARTSGDISRKTYLSELKRRDVLSSAVDIEAELDAIENEGPPPGNDDDGDVSPPGIDE